MSPLWELAISICLVGGAGFCLLGAIGLVKLPDFLCRLHALGAISTLGITALALGSLLYFRGSGAGPGWHVLLLPLFLAVATPITAHLLALTALPIKPPSKDEGGE